jgi:hypothetical protein
VVAISPHGPPEGWSAAEYRLKGRRGGKPDLAWIPPGLDPQTAIAAALGKPESEVQLKFWGGTAQQARTEPARPTEPNHPAPEPEPTIAEPPLHSDPEPEAPPSRHTVEPPEPLAAEQSVREQPEPPPQPRPTKPPWHKPWIADCSWRLYDQERRRDPSDWIDAEEFHRRTAPGYEDRPPAHPPEVVIQTPSLARAWPPSADPRADRRTKPLNFAVMLRDDPDEGRLLTTADLGFAPDEPLHWSTNRLLPRGVMSG